MISVVGGSNAELLLDLLHSYRMKDGCGPSLAAELSVANKMEAEDDHGSSGSYEVSSTNSLE